MSHAKRPMLSAVIAMAENRVIGKNNQLPWRLPADLKHFKAITIGHAVLMGRKTYESIGKPLPQRTNIVLTRNPRFVAPGCLVVTSSEEAIQYAKSENKEIFIIGGAEIYQQLLPEIQRIHLTLIHHHFAGDTYFPELNPHEWQEVENISHASDQENAYAYSFLTLERIAQLT